MKRIVMSLFTVCLGIVPAYALVTGQKPTSSSCNLTPANSPAIRDVKLGMSLQQLLAMFPASGKRAGMKEALDKAKAATGNETVYLLFDPAGDGGGEQFSGVDSVIVGVSNGQVVDYSISYSGPTWGSVDEWVDKLAETLGLPAARGWAAGPNENPNKVLKCKGVEIEAALLGGGASIRVRNTENNRGMEGRNDGAEEKKRRGFKP